MYEGIEIGFIMGLLNRMLTGHFENVDYYLFLLSASHWAYGGDRHLDNTNKKFVNNHSLILSLLVACFCLHHMNKDAWIPVQCLSMPLYVPFKKQFPQLKPLYISSLWTACIFMPEQHINTMEVLSCFLNLWAISNEKDNHDVKQDLKNGIKTYPVKHGLVKSKKLSKQLNLFSVMTMLGTPNLSIGKSCFLTGNIIKIIK
jgi:4-hydroxybenzoate polyprenyltransferase